MTDSGSGTGAPTAVSGAPTKKDEKKNPLKELVEKKTDELNHLLGKKKEKSLPPLPALPKIQLPQLPKLSDLKKDKKEKSPAPPATGVSGAPVVNNEKKDLPVPVSTIDLKKVLGRKM